MPNNTSNTKTENLLENPFADGDAGDTSSNDEFRLDKYNNESRWRVGARAKRRDESFQEMSGQGRDPTLAKKKIRPGLNVVTNFAKPSKKAATDNNTKKQSTQKRPQVEQEPATGPRRIEIKPDFLANIAANPSQIIQNRDQVRRNANAKNQDETHDNPPSQSQSKHPLHIRNPTLDTLKRSDTKTTDVSPSAKTVVIGIEEHDLDSAAREAADTPNSITPITPSILITPAYETDDWHTQSSQSEHNTRRRPTSSIYSQATALARSYGPFSAVAPPVPKLPDSEKVDSKAIGRDSTEGENNVQVLRPRPSDDETKKGILRRSIDSLASRPQSKGWWNLGLSPMLSRAGTIASRKSPFEDDQTPPVPPIPSSQANTSKGLGLQEKDWESEFSPQTPRRNGTDSERASTWSSWSDWENMRDGPDLSTMNAHEAAKARQQAEGPDVRMSTGPVVGGLAAEYFHASAHDLISPAPYFECQNHDCAAQLPKLESIVEVPLSNGSKGLQLQASGQNGTARNGIGGEADIEAKDSLDGSKKVRPDIDSRSRSGSDSTFIEDEPSPSPTQRKIDGLPKGEGKGEAKDSIATPPSTAEQPRSIDPAPVAAPKEVPKKPLPYPVETPPPAAPVSPPPITPAFERNMTSTGDIPMLRVQHVVEVPKAQPVHETVQMPAPRAPFVRENSHDGPAQPSLTTRPPAHAAPMPSPAFFAPIQQNGRDPPTRKTSLEDDRKPPSPASSTKPFAKFRRDRDVEQNEKKAKKEKGPGILSRLAKFLPKKKPTEQNKKKKTLVYALIAFVLFAIVLTVLLLALLLTRRGDNTPVESQWLNLTGYPPIPTGISTVARPELSDDNSDCVFPKTMWSCSLPKEQQASVAPNNANQPNFRIEIRFKNGTVSSNGTAVAPQRRDPFTNDLFTPNPAPPSLAEQSFLGNTTDNTTAPFEGEPTPFFISFLDPAQLPSSSSSSSAKPSKRSAAPEPIPQSPSSPSSTSSTPSSSAAASSSSPSSTSSSSSSSTSSLPSLPTSLPPPSSLSLPNGTAQPANLLPTTLHSQPLRLYDRSLPTEHYGFYTYFDRSIFLQSDAPLNATTQDEGDIPGDENGGSERDGGARVRCTFAQTRMKVQIWTRAGEEGAGLLGDPKNNTQSNDEGGKVTDEDKVSSANNFLQPGSLPYPVTITIDRHGGNPESKLLFCYELDDRGKIIGKGKVQQEFRGVGGQLVNPVPGLFDLSGGKDGDAGDGGFDIHAGGVDGGSGGCGCQWRNFKGGPEEVGGKEGF
ncbi:MAG: hypothetical protein Q9160_005832 [Pyrenula sp. 1 TL-2023]